MIRSFAVTLAVALVPVALAPSVAEAKCARMNQQPVVLSTQRTTPADGGILVATREVMYDEANEGEALQPSWRFVVGTKQLAPVTVTLAPGLVVYKLPPKVRHATLRGDKRTRATLQLGDARPRLPAPVVTSIVHVRTQGRRSSATTTVTLSHPPAGVVAIVLADAAGVARSFGTAAAGDDEVVAYHQRSCGVVPDGTLASAAGDRVVVKFVDQYGRLSPASKVLKVVGKAPDPF